MSTRFTIKIIFWIFFLRGYRNAQVASIGNDFSGNDFSWWNPDDIGIGSGGPWAGEKRGRRDTLITGEHSDTSSGAEGQDSVRKTYDDVERLEKELANELLELSRGMFPEDPCNSQSCQGKCQDPPVDDRDACSCDAKCSHFGDCCEDWYQYCFDEQWEDLLNLTESDEDISKKALDNSITLHSYSECLTINGISDPVKVVTSCPPDFNNLHVRKKCEKIDLNSSLSQIPSSNDLTIFRNQFCARCHGLSPQQYMVWNLTLECLSRRNVLIAQVLLKISSSFFDIFVLKYCRFDVTPPELDGYTLIDRLSKSCSARSCYSYATNMGDSRVKSLCQMFWAPMENRDGVKYKNIHCILCEYDNISKLLEGAPFYCSEEHGQVVPGHPWPDGGMGQLRPTFSILVDIRGGMDPQNVLLNIENLCPQNEVFNVLTGECSDICGVGLFRSKDGICLKISRPKQSYKIGNESYTFQNTTSVSIIIENQSDLDFTPFYYARFQLLDANGNCSGILEKNLGSNMATLLDENGDFSSSGCYHLISYDRETTNAFISNFRQLSHDIIRVFLRNKSGAVIFLNNDWDNTGRLSCEEGTKRVYNDNHITHTGEASGDNDILVSIPQLDSTYRYNGIPSVFVGYSPVNFSITFVNTSSICVSPLWDCPKRTVPKSKVAITENDTLITEEGTMFMVWEYATLSENYLVCGHEVQSSILPYIESIVSIVLSAVSIACLIITIAVYLILKTLRTTAGIGILNLSICLCTAQILLMVGFAYHDVSYIGCKVNTVVMHICWLASFCWSTILAYDMKSRFGSQILHVAQNERKIIIRYHLLAWALPFLIVPTFVILDTIHKVDFEYFGRSACVVQRGLATLLGFVLPAALTTAVNIILFSITLFGLRKSMSQASRAKPVEKRHQRRELCIYIRLTSLMGFNWLFGLLTAIYIDNYVIRFMFNIVSGLQGLFIFVSFIAKPSVWKMLKDVIKPVRIGRDTSKLNGSESTTMSSVTSVS